MTPEVKRRTDWLINTLGLHGQVPVVLWKIEDIAPIRFEDIDPLLGALLPPPDGWPTRPDNKPRIIIDTSLSEREARWVIAHEIGHGLCRHAGYVQSLMIGRLDKNEREAWHVAAHLLIPERVIMEERHIDCIAHVCDVPTWLVKLRWR